MESNNNITTSYDDPAPGVRIAFTNFFGRSIQTTVTTRPDVIHNWICSYWNLYGRHHGNRLIVGVGVQWRPSNNRRADTLSLCIGSRCLLIQLSHTPRIPIILRWFLGDRDIHFVGIRNRFDGQRLLNNEHWLFIPNLIDLSGIVDLGPDFESSRRNLARFVLGIHGLPSDRQVMRSDWRAEYLTVNQVQYAVVDAYISFHVGRIFNIWQVPNC